MCERVDSASKHIMATPGAIFKAFEQPGAMEQWLAPRGATGEMLRFDFREGGGYHLRLRFNGTGYAQGKTSEDSDEVTVRLTRIEPGRRIEQEVVFESDDPSFAGTMRMSWTFKPEDRGATVTVRAEDVPTGIRPQDHQTGLHSSLENLARFVETSD